MVGIVDNFVQGCEHQIVIQVSQLGLNQRVTFGHGMHSEELLDVLEERSTHRQVQTVDESVLLV